jgi:hypothetical protein
MLRLFSLSLLFSCLWLGAGAQDVVVQITPHGSWNTSSKLEGYYGKYKATDAFGFGGSLSIGKGFEASGVTRSAFFDIQYNYYKCEGSYYTYNGLEAGELGDLSVHSILGGVTKGTGNGVVEGYGGFWMGATIYDPSYSSDSYTRFTMSFGAGLKYYMSEKVGLRLNGQMNMPIWGGDFVVSWYPGAGVSPGAMASAVSVYGQFSLGIFANLGQ